MSNTDQARCPSCSAQTEGTAWERYRVCGACRYHFQLTASERIDLLADPESFQASNPSLVSVDPLVFTDRVSYRDRLELARRETSLNEAIVTGTARINGRDCVLAVFDFAFMGGSMGSVVGEKVALALELAADRRIPFIAVVASGGARMQEGMLSLVQMGKTAAAAMRLHQAGVPSITVLTNPTTGGVYASFASQGDFLLAEPGALDRLCRTARDRAVDGRAATSRHPHGRVSARARPARRRRRSRSAARRAGDAAAALPVLATRPRACRPTPTVRPRSSPNPPGRKSCWPAGRTAQPPPTTFDGCCRSSSSCMAIASSATTRR